MKTLSVKKPTLDEVATVVDVPKEDHAPKAIAPTPEQILAIKVFSPNQMSVHTFLLWLYYISFVYYNFDCYESDFCFSFIYFAPFSMVPKNYNFLVSNLVYYVVK